MSSNNDVVSSQWTWRSPHLLRLNYCLLSLVLFASANGYDGSLINCLQAISNWNSFLSNPTGAYLGIISAIYWLGMMFCYLFCASISSRWGRKLGLYFGYFLILVASAIQAGAQNSAMFIVSRALAGCAAGFWSSNAPVLIAEMAFPTHRPTLSTLYQGGFYIGSTLAAWICFGTWDYTSSWSWRVPGICQLILPCLALPGLIMCPESPRWLASKHRVDEARSILIKWHGNGETNCPIVERQMGEIQAALALEKEANATSYLDMLKTKGNRKRLAITISLALFSQWVGNGVVSFYLTTVLNSVGVTDVSSQLAITASLSMWNFIIAVYASLYVDRVGRRFLFLASAGVMAVSFILVTGLSATFAETGNTAAGLAVVPFLYIFFAGYAMGLTPLTFGYTVEIWQTNLRARGISVAWFFCCLFSSFNIFVNPIALDAITWKYYFVFLVIIVVYGLSAYIFFPETRGYSLEGIAALFDQEDTLEGSESKAADAATISADRSSMIKQPIDV